ncbi:MAG TPA: hypothetical protein VMW73_17055 [Spirochaetia bacterium]|nr:hypothetical protein [Spirochaetia bacterium]
MAECDCLAGCPFFHDKMTNMPALSGMMKKRYCLDDFMACARHQVKEELGKQTVPSDMYPSQFARARQMILAARPASAPQSPV